MSLIVLLIGGYVVYVGVTSWLRLQKNIRDAKRSGLPYIVSPVDSFWRSWQITHRLWIPLIKLLPNWCWEDWVDISIPTFGVERRHDWFAEFGETVLIATPGRLALYTDNPEAIRQITLKREQFPKWTATYNVLRQFGENVLTTEGPEWRMHRKATSATFNEKNAALVFYEAVSQTLRMANQWMGPLGPGKKASLRVAHDTMRLALNIISYVGFGMRMLWPGEKLPEGIEERLAKYASLEAPKGHRMSFGDTMEILLENILMLLLVPRWLLSQLPSEVTRQAVVASEEYDQYMNELLDERIEDARAGKLLDEGMDLMGQLAKASYGAGSEKNQGNVLTREEIIGNAFILFVAGHETTANIMHFVLVYLAMSPSSQRRLQMDVDKLVGTSDPSEWKYEELVNPMLASMLGASMYEAMRLMPPVVGIPKIVPKEEPMIIDGKQYVIPKGTTISIITTAAHTHPRYWPAEPSKVHPGKDDLLDFIPERWFRTGAKESSKGEESVKGADTEDYGGFSGRDTNEQLFKPERGAYVPFSDGPRSCLGRRIAQVELMAFLAVIFQRYSVELGTDEWASPEDVEKMSKEEKTRLYEKAAQKTRATLGLADIRLMLKLYGDNHVPLRLVKRGEEQFVNWLDQE